MRNHAQLSHNVKVVESTINQRDDDIVRQIIAYEPDVIGISTYIWNAGKLPNILGVLRERLPKTVFVLGGPEASHNAEHWLEYGADFVLCGEGEGSFPAFVDTISVGTDFEQVPGLCWKHNNQLFINPQAKPSNDVVNPYNSTYFSTLNGRIAYIETSRGCPFQCAFCLSGTSDIRFFPMDTAKRQIYELSVSGAQTIKFVDRTFNCNPQRAHEIFEYIIQMETDCCFHFEVAADLFDARTLSLLATAPAGRIQFEAGLQSFFEPALNASSRHTDLVKAEKNIALLLDNGNIHVHVDLIAGLPYETLDDFKNSFDRAYAIGAHTLQLGFLKLLHGSALREKWKSIVSSQQPPYEILKSPWLSAEDLLTIKHTENALQHTYNQGRFLSTLKYVICASKLRPFSFYQMLGEAVPNHGTQLACYAEQIYEFCSKLTGVDPNQLCDCMVIDWLGMVKGENMPCFLRSENNRRKQISLIAEKVLKRKVKRNEVAVLQAGKGVFVDSQRRNIVTGLYQLYYSD